MNCFLDVRMKITIAQLNNTVGDIDGNIAKAKETIASEESKNSDLIVFSELFISGYPPEDLVLKASFLDACLKGLEEIVQYTKDLNIGIIIGVPIKEGEKIFNSAALIDKGKIIGISKKKSLYDISTSFNTISFKFMVGTDHPSLCAHWEKID